MVKPSDLGLLKELKAAYRFHNQGNKAAFTDALTRVIISYGAELERVDERIRKEIAGI